MDEFNLIPGGYSEEVRFRRNVIRFSYMYVGLIIIIIVAYLSLNADTNNHIKSLTEVTNAQFSNEVLSAKVDALVDRESTLQQQHQLLTSVNEELSLTNLLMQFDLALNNSIEFSLFEFERSKIANESDGVAVIRVIGKAKSHASMAEFMGKLAEQNTVVNVELNKSRADQGQTKNINFELAVLVGKQVNRQ